MSNLQVLEPTTSTSTIDSREVAEMVGKEHKELLRDIRRYVEQFAEGNLALGEFFQEGTYQDANKQTRPCYEVTRKGCEFIANKLTGVKGTEFTARYINRFHAMEETIQNTQPNPFEGISTELQAILMQDRKIQVVETRVDKLENTMVVDHGQGKELQTLGKARVMATLLGRESKAYKDKTLSKKVFTAIWHDYKDYFNINSYHNTPVARFNEAKEYLKTWVPSNNLQIEINMVNRGEI